VAESVVFNDRAEAGHRLGAALLERRGRGGDAVVCGIPRGGVVVAAEVARILELPLRAVIARKIGAPGHAELAIGAVGPDGIVVLDEDLVRRTGATREWLERAIAAARAQVAERVAALPNVVSAAEVNGREVFAVDDGVATGSTAAAVGRWLGHVGASRRVLALPVGPPDTLARLADDYDDVVALAQPQGFIAVGQWYRDFRQTTDDEVIGLLSGSASPGD
jgi:putative phosphoribosyl transferase